MPETSIETSERAAAAQISRLRAALKRYVEYVITVRDRNTVEWLRRLETETNNALEVIGEPDRVVLGPGYFRIARAKPEKR
ncbi:MAG TPA: hypothetical protein VFA50_15040 [Stellaceae bacterium]|nr:hypothetical protein [Stellaceae bacterium]